jgi:hypothetical protein
LDKGVEVGTVSFYLAGEKIGEVAIFTEDVAKAGGPWTLWGISDFIAYLIMAIIGLGLLLLLGGLRVRSRRKKVMEKRKRIEETRIAREQELLKENKRKRDWPY